MHINKPKKLNTKNKASYPDLIAAYIWHWARKRAALSLPFRSTTREWVGRTVFNANRDEERKVPSSADMGRRSSMSTECVTTTDDAAAASTDVRRPTSDRVNKDKVVVDAGVDLAVVVTVVNPGPSGATFASVHRLPSCTSIDPSLCTQLQRPPSPPPAFKRKPLRKYN